MTLLTTGWLAELTETPGGPGDEGAVRDFIARSLYKKVDELRVDSIGNLIAIKRGTGSSGPKIVVTAHMDEVTLFVTDIDNDGFLHVASCGYVNPRTLLGKVVQVGAERLPGVISAMPVHHTNGTDRRTVPEVKDLAIDIGANDQDAAKNKVKIGTRIAFKTPFRLLGLDETFDEHAPLPERGRISGKALDNRLGCALLSELLAGERLDFDLTGVFTVQEEIGTRGALVAAHNLNPDIVIVLEGTICDDLPGPPGEERFPTTRLGDGPALTQRDRSYIVSPPILQHFIKVAANHNIPYQFKHPNIGGTDAQGFARLRPLYAGIISVPCRYIHGPVAIAELSDFHNSLALLRAALPGLAQVTLQGKHL